MSKMLIGKAALTAIRLTDGRRANLPAGRAVPENIDPADAERLLAEGFLTEVEILDEVAQIDPADLDLEGPAVDHPSGVVPAGLTFDDVTTDLAGGGEVEVTAEPFTDEELAEVRKGNVDQQLDKVGDDPVKAQQVLDAEQAAAKPRTTLLTGLQDVLDAAAVAEGEE